MHQQQVEQSIQCPYCWESIDVLLDPSIAYQEYIEDCQVCCRPITFIVRSDHEGDVHLHVRHEDDG